MGVHFNAEELDREWRFQLMPFVRQHLREAEAGAKLLRILRRLEFKTPASFGDACAAGTANESCEGKR